MASDGGSRSGGDGQADDWQLDSHTNAITDLAGGFDSQQTLRKSPAEVGTFEERSELEKLSLGEAGSQPDWEIRKKEGSPPTERQGGVRPAARSKRSLEQVNESSDETCYASAHRLSPTSMLDGPPSLADQDHPGIATTMYGTSLPLASLSSNPAGAPSYNSDSQEQPPSKRTLQNRKAQREFRQRRASYLKDLEEKVRQLEGGRADGPTDLQQRITQLTEENQYLRSMLARLQHENAAYRTRDLQYQTQLQQHRQQSQQQQQQQQQPQQHQEHPQDDVRPPIRQYLPQDRLSPLHSVSAPASTSHANTSHSNTYFSGHTSPLRYPLQLENPDSSSASSNSAVGSFVEVGSAQQQQQQPPQQQQQQTIAKEGPHAYGGRAFAALPLDGFTEQRRTSTSSTASAPGAASTARSQAFRDGGEDWFYPHFSEKSAHARSDTSLQDLAQSQLLGDQHHQQSHRHQPSAPIRSGTPPSIVSTSSWPPGPNFTTYPHYNQSMAMNTAHGSFPYPSYPPPLTHLPSLQQPSSWSTSLGFPQSSGSASYPGRPNQSITNSPVPTRPTL